MRILDRYFLKEFVRPLLYCLGAFLLCWFVYDLMDNFNEFMESGDFVGVIKYYMIILPAWLVQVTPITLLLALLYTLADMSKSGELIAMRATGMDLYRLMIPIFVIAGFITVVTLFLNVIWAPRAQMLAKEQEENMGSKSSKIAAVKGIGNDIFYKSLQSSRTWYIEELDYDKKTAKDIDLVQSKNDGEDLIKYVAERGVYSDDHWILYDVHVYDLQKKEVDPASTQFMRRVELPKCKEDPEGFRIKLKKPKRMTSMELLTSLQIEKEMPRLRKAQYRTELYQRFAFPFSNLIVILIGVPFGMIHHRRSTFIAVTNALLIFFAYQLMSQLFIVLGNNDQVPALIASWLPNIAFGTLGVFLIRRIR